MKMHANLPKFQRKTFVVQENFLEMKLKIKEFISENIKRR